MNYFSNFNEETGDGMDTLNVQPKIISNNAVFKYLQSENQQNSNAPKPVKIPPIFI